MTKLTPAQAADVWAGSFTGEPTQMSEADRAWLSAQVVEPYLHGQLTAQLSLHYRRLVRARAGDVGTATKVYTHAPDDVIGVRGGNDLRAMTSSGFATLAAPPTRGLWAAQHIDRTLPTLERKGIATSRINPLVLVLDRSGSMTKPLGLFDEQKVSREVFGIAVALLMSSMARTMGRPCYLVQFGSRAVLTRLDLGPRHLWETVHAPTLFRALGSGTSYYAALELLIQAAKSEHWGKADLVFLSDGDSAYYEPLLPAWRQRCEENNIRCLGIALGDEVEEKHVAAVALGATMALRSLVAAHARPLFDFLASAL